MTPLFEAVDADDSTYRGELIQLSDKHVQLRNAAKTVSIPVERLVALERVRKSGAARQDTRRDASNEEPGTDHPVFLALRDGSRLVLGETTLENGKLNTHRSQAELTIPITAVESLRFLEFSTTQRSEDWDRLAKTPSIGDRLVVDRGGGLDTFNGVVRGINAATVLFESEGEELPVPRAKLVGVFFYHPNPAVPPHASETIVRLSERSGSRIVLSEALLRDGLLHWKNTGAGIAGTTPPEEIDRLDYAPHHGISLWELEPVQITTVPPYATGNDKDRADGSWQAMLRQWSLPRLETSREPTAAFPASLLESLEKTEPSQGTRLDGVFYPEAKTLYARTTLEYHLKEPFERLRGLVGIADAIRPGGRARLVIRGDDRVLFDRELRGDTAAERWSVSLEGVEHLRLTVDFPESVGAAAQVTFGTVRLERKRPSRPAD